MGHRVFQCTLVSDKRDKVVEVHRDFAKLIKTGLSNLVPFPSNETALLGRSVLFGHQSKHISGSLGRDHPLWKGQVHPSTLDGLESVIGRLCLGRIKPLQEMQAEIPPGSAVVTGGPVSTREARLIFGIGGTSPLLGVRLPFSFRYWDRFPEAIETNAEPWELVVDGVPASSVKECLIITVLPMGEVDRIVNIAGLHGAGTRAIDFILRNEKLLQRIERETRSLVGWQTFVEVKSIDTEIPVGLGDLKVREIKGLDFDSIRHFIRSRLFLHTEVESLDNQGMSGVKSLPSVTSTRSAALRRSEGALKAAPHQEHESMSDPPKTDESKPAKVASDPRARLIDALCDDLDSVSDDEFRELAEELGGQRALAEEFEKIFQRSAQKLPVGGRKHRQRQSD